MPAVNGVAPADLCGLVKDAYGNLTRDPRCPAAAPAGGSTGAQPDTAPAAKRFPFPGSDDSPAAPAPAPAPGTQAPADSSGAPAARRFPYPGETGAPATGATQPGAPTPGQPPLNDAGSSGSSSSSSSSDSSSSSSSSSSKDEQGKSADDDTADDPDAAPKRRTRRKLPPVPRQSPSEREQEDVQVAGFYQNDGNFKGAYERASDAVSLDKTDPSAHLALAESARKLGKLDEALKEYRQCLELDPVPKERRVAEKSLKEMTGGG